MRFQVLVRLKGGVLDVQGKAIETGLKDKKFNGLQNSRVGRVIELDVDGVEVDEIDVLDVSAVVASGRFNNGDAATWADGDFNHDGTIDVLDISDLIGASLFNAGPYRPPSAG